MDSRLIKAIVVGDLKLAKQAISDSSTKELNYIFYNKNSPTIAPYTILDATLKEGAQYGPDHPIKQIIVEMQQAGARTYNEIIKMKSGLPPLHIPARRGRNNILGGIAMGSKTRKNSSSKNTNGFTDDKYWNNI
jgi:hypothetical protein